jgi:hypothetical protein
MKYSLGWPGRADGLGRKDVGLGGSELAGTALDAALLGEGALEEAHMAFERYVLLVEGTKQSRAVSVVVESYVTVHSLEAEEATEVAAGTEQTYIAPNVHIRVPGRGRCARGRCLDTEP